MKNICYFDNAYFKENNGIQCFLLSDELKKIEVLIKVHSVEFYGNDINQWTVQVVSDTGKNFQRRNKFNSEDSAKTFANSIISKLK
jgi:hypothetical protein